MRTYEFTLHIENISIRSNEDLQNVSTALYAGRCEDAFIGSIDDAMYIEFERKAESLESAIIQATKDVESTRGYNLTVTSFEGNLLPLTEVTESIKNKLSK